MVCAATGRMCRHRQVIELNLSCPNVEEAPETAAELVAAARADDGKAALREALAGDVGHRRDRTGSRRRGRGRSLARQHDSRARRSTRSLSCPKLGRGAADTPARRCGRWHSPVSTRVRRPSSCRSSAWAASSTGDDAVDLVAVGASAVALGTILFADPCAPGGSATSSTSVEPAPASPRPAFAARTTSAAAVDSSAIRQRKNTCK